jgi:hypothetical protein
MQMLSQSSLDSKVAPSLREIAFERGLQANTPQALAEVYGPEAQNHQARTDPLAAILDESGRAKSKF